jgi:hypothetical protein
MQRRQQVPSPLREKVRMREKSVGVVASFLLKAIALRSLSDGEVEERGNDRLQGEPL